MLERANSLENFRYIFDSACIINTALKGLDKAGITTMKYKDCIQTFNLAGRMRLLVAGGGPLAGSFLRGLEVA